MSRLINQNGLDLVKHFEGLYTDAYTCPAGVPTIGYGHTANVELGQSITPQEAEDILQEDMQIFAVAVEKTIVVELNDNQFAALVSFAFNCGAGNLRASTLCRKLNAGDYDCVPSELARWVKATDPSTGKKRSLAGLVKRRAAEATLFLKQMSEIKASLSEKMPQKVDAEPETVVEQYKVNARSGLRMRAGAGAEFEILATLPLHKTLSTGKEIDNWVEVDLECDGVIDGWVYKTYLVKI
ncbi:glycoside hydrolase family protein [Candidatus Colwellia aromaticivorans]|uniref:glycoside hydrolase family protein n=1 Tax=Candidatus Colwellia aromaticivorans TaxID=2267621 RepID=UPI000DF14846|nr:glycoside hydrolase family protein [Candidatus Colwellia aromaticivorans]